MLVRSAGEVNRGDFSLISSALSFLKKTKLKYLPFTQKTSFVMFVLCEKNASLQSILNNRNASREEKKGVLREISLLG